ncbi:MAG TPA: hypothetical protein VIG33_15515, partial [Pseudobdellovibrionaceae bacterium]
QTLIEEWRNPNVHSYGTDIAKFASDLVEVFTAVQKFLHSSEIAVVEPIENSSSGAFSPEGPAEIEESFESQRLQSYIDSAEGGKVADECQNASVWQTDQAELCQSDDALECDRSYARQCKKLQ